MDSMVINTSYTDSFNIMHKFSFTSFCVNSVCLCVCKQDIDWVQTEKHVFEQASNHPFLVGLHSCFQTESRSDTHTLDCAYNLNGVCDLEHAYSYFLCVCV